MSKLDGGPAFPVALMTAPNGQVYGGEFGMSLRDHFAAAAMNGLMQLSAPTDSDWDPTREARAAYQIADAMITERAK